MFIIFLILVWTSISIYWFFSIMGDKYREDRWYDIFLITPVFIIMVVISLFQKNR